MIARKKALRVTRILTPMEREDVKRRINRDSCGYITKYSKNDNYKSRFLWLHNK